MKKKHMFISRLMMMFCLFAVSAYAGAEQTYIQCPLEEVRTEIVSKLPGGWWQTPQVWPLEGVRTQNIGGQPTLVCLYRAYNGLAPVMRLYPAGLDCIAAGTGFRCFSGPVTPPSTLQEYRHESPPKDIKRVPDRVGNGTKGTQESLTVMEPGTVKQIPVKIAKDYPGSGGKSVPGKSMYGEKEPAPASGPIKHGKGQGCPDPAVVELSMPNNWVSFSGDGKNGYFRLMATVQNAGSEPYMSGPNQQMITIYEMTAAGKLTQRATAYFKDLKPGAYTTAQYDVVGWALTGKNVKRNPKFFEAEITYDPDIRVDNNPANDDCGSKNNTRRLSGSEIDQVLHAAWESTFESNR